MHQYILNQYGEAGWDCGGKAHCWDHLRESKFDWKDAEESHSAEWLGDKKVVEFFYSWQEKRNAQEPGVYKQLYIN